MRRFFLFLAVGLWINPAWAMLSIEITQRLPDATPIAVVNFAGLQVVGESPLATIIRTDLERSGEFRPLRPDQMPGLASTAAEVLPGPWAQTETQWIVVGRVQREGERAMKVRFEILRAAGLTRVVDETFTVDLARWRDAAHFISDRIYQTVTGQRGIFSTRLLYVNEYQRGGRKRYRLAISDVDGARQTTLLDSQEPIMSPTWSPDARHVAYVSFEQRRPIIFKQNLATRERVRLAEFPGLNGAPAWSPNGQQLALTLSRDGNPELYVMDLATRALRRLTQHPAIDTEPRWHPNGQSLVFTSDRSGTAQIYQVSLSGDEPRRLTFNGRFNARADISPDGRHIAMVHMTESRNYAVAVQDLQNQLFTLLTTTPLDESPSFSPNGRLLVYATKNGAQGVLGIMSLDGRFKMRLPAIEGQVREPAWSPYLR